MASAEIENPLVPPPKKHGGGKPLNVNWPAIQGFFTMGKTMAELSKMFGININTIKSRSKAENWSAYRVQTVENIPLSDKVMKTLAEQAADYKATVSKEINKGLTALSKHQPESVKDIKEHGHALQAFHPVAKDIFGIGNEPPIHSFTINLAALELPAELVAAEIIDVEATKLPDTDPKTS